MVDKHRFDNIGQPHDNEFDTIENVVRLIQDGYHDEVKMALNHIPELIEKRNNGITCEHKEKHCDGMEEAGRQLAESLYKLGAKDVTIIRKTHYAADDFDGCGDDNDDYDDENWIDCIGDCVECEHFEECEEATYQASRRCNGDCDECPDYGFLNDEEGKIPFGISSFICDLSDFSGQPKVSEEETGSEEKSVTFSNAKNVIVSVPTIYGNALLIQTEDIDSPEMNEALDAYCDETEKWIFLNVSIENGAIVFEPYDDNPSDPSPSGWHMLIPDALTICDYGDSDKNWKIGIAYISNMMKAIEGRLVFPFLDGGEDWEIIGIHYCDAFNAIESLMEFHSHGLGDFEMPLIAYKVTHPNMTCRDMHYEMDTAYGMPDEDISFRHTGFHYAKTPEAAYNWYRFDKKNEVYRVQVGPARIEEGDKGVTSSLVFTKKLAWDELE